MNEELEHNDLISRWLNGELSEEEQEKLEQSEELNDLKIVLGDIDTWSVKKYDAEQGLTKLKAKQDNLSTKVIQWRSVMKVAAMITLLLVAYFGWDKIINDGEIKIASGIGEIKEIKLPDGSFIQLDAASKIAYNEKSWNEDRSLSLSGQAYFEVEKGATFTVNTNQGTVEVLGTRFNVQVEKEVFSVKCFEGRVSVQTNTEAQIIGAKESVRLLKGKLKRQSHDENEPDWTEGFSTYNEAPLSEVVRDLKKRYAVEIDLPNKYQDLNFRGKVTHNDLDRALKGIFIPMEISYTLNNDGKVVFK